MTDTSRRTFISIATATAAVGLAGCSGDDDGGESTEEAMTEGEMTEGEMTEGEMTEEAMTEGEMTEGEMDEEMTEEAMTEEAMTEEEMMGTETFEVTVTATSEAGTITTSDGDDVEVPLSPTAYAVHSSDVTAFSEGESASAGLESLAEDGHPSTLAEELTGVEGVETVDAAAVPDGADEAAPLHSNESYTFEVEAGHDHNLTLATMFVQSNDLFYAPDPEGIALFEDGEAVEGDVTDELVLWDAGTEQNQEPGAGPDQAPRQDGDDTGPAEDATVRSIDAVDDGYDYPETSDVIEVTITTM